MLVLLCSCARGTQLRGDGTLVVAQTREFHSLNPLFETGFVSEELGSLIFSYLLRVDDRGRIDPEIALAEPTVANGGVSRDGRTIVFHLRHGVRWHDGVELTSRDVLFTYRAIMNPENNVDDRYPYDQIASVDAPDPYTVRLHMHAPYAPIVMGFFSNDGNFSILPAHLLERYRNLNTADFNAAPVGSGPYRFVDWQHGDHITLDANPHYWRGAPHIARIVLRFVPEPTTIVNELRTREAQVYLAADPSSVPALRTIRHVRVSQTVTGSTAMVIFNAQRSPTNDVRVRRALAQAIDRSIAAKVTDGVFSDAHAMRGLFSWAYDPTAAPLLHDLGAAQRLLDASGWRRGADGTRTKAGQRLDVEIILRNDTPALKKMALYIQRTLLALGAQSSIKEFIPSEFINRGGAATDGRFHLALVAILANYDPEVSWFITCAHLAPGGYDLSRYCTRQTDRIVTDAARTFDTSLRKRDYALVQRQIYADVPFLPLWENDEIDAYDRDLHGLRTSYQGPFWNVSDWTLPAN